MDRRRRIGAYAVCRDRAGRTLLVRASARTARPGTWFPPGGGVDHGEDPAAAVVRELVEETGLEVTVVRARDVAVEVLVRPPFLEHTDGILYDVAVTGGRLRPETGGTSDRVAWVAPAEAAQLPLSRLAAIALDLPPPPVPPVPADPDPTPPGPRPRPARGQRFGVYALATDPASRVLLTLIADGYPGAGHWHLPGGGTDFGEQPRDGLLRELVEESDQRGRLADLLAVTHHHNQAARGPEGYPIDWHGVRALFEVAVDAPTEPRVRDADGSTAQAGWFTRAEAARLPLTEFTAASLAPTTDIPEETT